MSYTPPSASAADATWLGAAAYTSPAASAANASFDSGRIASGFTSTQFGAPTSRSTQEATGFLTGNFGTPIAPYFTTGFKSTQLGTPYAAFDQFGVATGFSSTVLSAHSTPLPATGFCSTHIGTPYGVFWQIVDATGFKPTQLGTAAGRQHWNVPATSPSTRFGTPATQTNRTLTATGLHTGVFGTPVGTRRAPPSTAQRGSASGAVTTRFGAPSAGWLQTGQVTGFTATCLGAPNGTQVQQATGFATGSFGAATAAVRAHAVGLAPARFGAPVLCITLPTTGFVNTTRWGLATTLRSNTYRAYGINASRRIGHPTGFSRFNHPEAGFCSTNVGTPTCHERHRASHIPPCAIFGRPMLKRITQC